MPSPRLVAAIAPFLGSAAAAQLIPTHTAAPPEEFAEPGAPLAPPDLARGPNSTSLAAIPIRLEPAPDGRLTWSRDIPIDDASRVSIMALPADGSEWDISLATPRAQIAPLTPANLRDRDHSVIGPARLGGLQTIATRFELFDRAPGLWTIQLAAPPDAAPTAREGVLLIDTVSARMLASHLATTNLVAGEKIAINALLHDSDGPRSHQPTPIPDAVTRATLTLKRDGAEPIVVPMHDDGRSADGAPRDGRYGAILPINDPGEYTAHIEIEGVDRNGRPLLRTAQHAFPVLSRDLEIAGDATAEPIEGGRLNVAVPVRVNAERTHVKLIAELWGVGADGQPVPVCWLGTMSAIDESDNLNTTLDARWIDRAGALRPFTLRNVRVLDPDTSIPFDSRDEIDLALDERAIIGVEFAGRITDDMRIAPARTECALPIDLDIDASTGRAFGAHNLMLIHGYCSEGVWPTGDFTGFTEVFLDANQNRSHDAFAQLIAAFGLTSKSYGIVAHSQGGAAALHLHANYFTGLHFAEGGRLIQSVGTPYQGTPLGGNLGALGEIFGSGCGANFDLSVDGAAMWLATIPSFSRSRVHYYTTSFLDDFGYDYCNLITDLFLSDPDDGVIEMTRGQLPGANNRGHVEGWCHTMGMRDPAQYTDQSRNAEMNANAAR